ncbi:MAG: DUF3048 domain-containing protein [Clostridia bacterium]|nr:DUF3048 domain-containing protein [Clostridia bacterium]
MKRNMFRVIAFILAFTAVLALTACGSTEPEETTAATTTEATTKASETTTIATTAEIITETSSEAEASRFVTSTEAVSETEATTEPEPEIPAVPVNYLTGEALPEGASDTYRPVAVSINNLRVASKYHSGLSEADIIYEVEVEGGITRLLALFSDPSSAARIGSVRSARPVMNCIILGHDAYFAHAGGSAQAVNEISSYGISDINAQTTYAGYFYYDDAVVKATSLEHGYFTTGEKLSRATASFVEKGGRGEIKEGHNKIFEFYAEPTVPEGALPCKTVITSYGGYEPCFTYSEETGKYAREEYGTAHIDVMTGEQLQFDNVIALSVTSVTKGEAAGYRYFDDVGSGVGILATQGTYINIKWSKSAYDAPIVLTTEDGAPLTVNVGKTFISYVNGESNFSVSAE